MQDTGNCLKTASTSVEIIVRRAKVRHISNTSGMLSKSLNVQFKEVIYCYSIKSNNTQAVNDLSIEDIGVKSRHKDWRNLDLVFAL